ncbi:MAG: methyltransferase domain-containing protein [Candidatus Coatesbacteria bacterium]|nr:methyltransferase domain-containing protein [Candidatus Coatesbacteria bacterium]
MSEWWEDFFDDVWAAGGFGGAGLEARSAEVGYIWRRLKLRPGARLADVCCGIGRCALPLARRGVWVIGVDFCAAYLERARRRAAGASAEFLEADMRSTGLKSASFDAVLNWWTSFGYFTDEAENARALAEWARLLRPGGRLLMQLVNRDGIMADFRPRSGRVAPDGWLLVEDSEPDYHTGRLKTRWTWVSPQGQRHQRLVDLRLYTLHELVNLAAPHGLDLVCAHGNLLEKPAGREFTHMYVTFAKLDES